MHSMQSFTSAYGTFEMSMDALFWKCVFVQIMHSVVSWASAYGLHEHGCIVWISVECASLRRLINIGESETTDKHRRVGDD